MWNQAAWAITSTFLLRRLPDMFTVLPGIFPIQGHGAAAVTIPGQHAALPLGLQVGAGDHAGQEAQAP